MILVKIKHASLYLIIFLLLINVSLINSKFASYFKNNNDAGDDDCFCQLHGKIDECTCNIDTVDHFNNVKIYPRLRSLLIKDYFRFYKVNLKKACPFWAGDDGRCAMKYCHIKPCHEKDIPSGIKGATNNNYNKRDAAAEKYSKESNEICRDNDELDYINKTISAKLKEDFDLWQAHDDALDNFCASVDENEDTDAEYVDLSINPERYTGYKGASAQRIWNSIYVENCFRPKGLLGIKNGSGFHLYIQSAKLSDMCLEERAYYRVISGLHTSINVHLCANYLLSNANNNNGLMSSINPNDPGEWGLNLNEFQRRFSPETTNGEGPNWLRNLYFVYLLELRALAKVAPYLEREEFYTSDEAKDWDTQLAVRDLLKIIQQFPGDHFDERAMFTGRAGDDAAATLKLKLAFREHFVNVTRIMDCVGCDKCKLWGKLQTQGLGTALKILFSNKLSTGGGGGDVVDAITDNRKFQLQRNEIVSLFNAFGRLSTSIYKLDDFRQLLKNGKT